MKRKLLILLFAALALCLALSAGAMARRARMERLSAESSALAHELVELPGPEPEPLPAEPGPSPVTQPEETPPQETESPELIVRDAYAEALADTDLAPLRELNGDVLGWIEIPDTRISYPLLQCGDNDYYLSHSWQRWDNPAGSIFLESQNAPDFSDFNTLIYGHRMNSGDMFGNLYMFSEKEYMDAHPRIYIVDDSGCRFYDIFAAYEVTVDSRIYAMNFSNELYKQAYIDHCLELSHVQSPVVPTPEDSIITLSTCSRSGIRNNRYVVQAVYVATAPRSLLPGTEIS